MPRILTKAQFKIYKAWYDSHNEVKRQYPRWYGRRDPDASGSQYER